MIATFLLVAVLLVGLLLGVPVAEDELGGSLGVAAERWRG